MKGTVRLFRLAAPVWAMFRQNADKALLRAWVLPTGAGRKVVKVGEKSDFSLAEMLVIVLSVNKRLDSVSTIFISFIL